MITKEELSRVMPRLLTKKRDLLLPFLQAAMTENQITTYLREAAFLAQLAHESGQLKYMQELASGAAYEGRRDLGNTRPGDGRRYKGRGPIQLTGRANYRKYGALLGLDLEGNPELAATPEVGFRVAGAFWRLHGLNELADQRLFKTITRRINGGYNGLADRIQYYERALQVLSKNDPVPSPAVVQSSRDDTPVRILVDGAPLVLNGDDTPATFDHGTVWVPVRALAEKLACTSPAWTPATATCRSPTAPRSACRST